MRELGTNSYRYVIGGNDGNINGLKGNFTASTDYEWHTKAWCTGNVDEDGNSDPMYHSGWGDFSAFTTEAPCDAMPMNLTTSSNGAQYGSNYVLGHTREWRTRPLLPRDD